MHRGRFLAVLAIAALVAVVLAGLAVEVMGDFAVGALLGALVVLAALGLRQQARYARRSAADLAALTQAVTSIDRSLAGTKKDVDSVSKDVAGVSKEVAGLSRTVTAWSKGVKVAEIEAGIDALNRYVALGSDDTAHGA
jgi:hypothetical protein